MCILRGATPCPFLGLEEMFAHGHGDEKDPIGMRRMALTGLKLGWVRRTGLLLCSVALILWSTAVSTAEDVEKGSKGPITQAQANRDWDECVASAQASIGSDYVVDTGPKLVANIPQRRVIAKYGSQEELNAIMRGITQHLIGSCLINRKYLEFDGFFVLPPKGENWTIDTSHAGLGIPVLFRRQVTPGMTGAGKAHTIVVMASVTMVELGRSNRQELLQKLRQSISDEWQERRYTLTAFEVSEHVVRGADCLMHSITAEDRGVRSFPASVFTFSKRGIRCVHPDLPAWQPRWVIDVGYSQRFLEGQWIAALDVEAEPFLRSLVLTWIEPSPYVISALQEYAKLLREMKRESEAAEMESRAKKLWESQQAGQPSRHLGFDPSALLWEYALTLRSRDQGLEAQETDLLANAYRARQVQHYLRFADL